jgi:hypothetical protein
MQGVCQFYYEGREPRFIWGAALLAVFLGARHGDENVPCLCTRGHPGADSAHGARRQHPIGAGDGQRGKSDDQADYPGAHQGIRGGGIAWISPGAIRETLSRITLELIGLRESGGWIRRHPADVADLVLEPRACSPQVSGKCRELAGLRFCWPGVVPGGFLQRPAKAKQQKKAMPQLWLHAAMPCRS